MNWKKPMKFFAILATAAVLSPIAAVAHDAIDVVDAYARGANPKAGAAFMVLDNHREVACTLVGVSSDAAAKTELHTHTEVEGVMKMHAIEGGIEVPPGAKHALQRGGDHVMLMGLTAPLEDGMTVALTLDFGDCGTQQIDVPVDNQRAADHAQMPHDDHAAHEGHEGHADH